ncbi:diatom-specific cyclin [Seminavis robusta]|uniref:Diatom-specific cyclin n=1 Tax=Seminavis robusta TaxID=568900 RepID=A0A9N8EDR7_9STRA|nr:diatom-specific cyclin [Seminavis robusta]|eukprot:Sro975_g226830.1 diatom-specific cyclin (302) ;mRNA; r:26603-27508
MNTPPSPFGADSVLAAMLRQEEAYLSDDYLYQQNELPQSVISGPLHTIEQDRAKMVGWQYQVADFCRFNRETVAISTSYFDRFLAKDSATEALANTDLFQLAAMTCFYTAAKIHEPESFEPWMLSKMSRGLYSAQQVEKMESVILKAVEWRMNPPTPLAFVRELLELLPESYLSEEMRPAVYDLCKFQTELCVRIYEFVPIKASTIAMAALLNALESLGVDYSALGFIEAFLARSIKDAGMMLDVREDIQNRLYQAVTEFSGIHTEAATSSTAYPAKQTLCKRSSPQTSPCTVYTTATTVQ